MSSLKTKKSVNRFISVGLIAAVTFSTFSSNCFAMRRAGGSGFGPSNPFFIGPPTPAQYMKMPPPPTPHKKWKAERHSYGYTETWAELGIDIASCVTGVALEQYVAKQLASKFVSRCGVKWATLLASKIKFVVPILQRMTANDLRTHHGIRIEVSCDVIKSTDCRCQISQDHGVDHGLIPINNISYKIYVV